MQNVDVMKLQRDDAGRTFSTVDDYMRFRESKNKMSGGRAPRVEVRDGKVFIPVTDIDTMVVDERGNIKLMEQVKSGDGDTVAAAKAQNAKAMAALAEMSKGSTDYYLADQEGDLSRATDERGAIPVEPRSVNPDNASSILRTLGALNGQAWDENLNVTPDDMLKMAARRRVK
jgi:Neuraminidase (sialidase)